MANINISQIRMKRGNTAAASNYVGPLGELLVDTGLQTVRVQDGATPGGMAVLATLTGLNQISGNVANLQTTTANIRANLSAFQTYANTTFGTSNYGNANVAAYLTTHPQSGLYGNANVVALLGAFGGNNISTTGTANIGAVNMSSGITWGGGSQVYEDTVLVAQGTVAVALTSPGDTTITAGTNTWRFGTDGTATIPSTLTFDTRGTNQRTGWAEALVFTKSGTQKSISTAGGTLSSPDVERLVIAGGDSYQDPGSGVFAPWSEGGDIYLWAGRGANGGDIKVDAGNARGVNGEQGGTIKIRGGSSQTGTGGFVHIESGSGNTNGEIQLTTPGHTWTFGPDGVLQFPNGDWNINQQRYGMGNLVAFNDSGWTLGEYNGSNYGTEGMRIAPGIEGANELILPSDNNSATQSVQLNNYSTGGVRINSNGNTWTFAADGTTTLPGGLNLAGNINFTASPAGAITGASLVSAQEFYSSGNVTIGGNLVINGNATTVGTRNLIIDDNIIYLANANPANSLDIGFAGHFTSGTYQHTGLVRQASTGQWKLFSNIAAEPGNTLDFTNAVYDAIQVGAISSPTITDLYSNASVQSANIATLFANAGVQSANIATLQSNAASQATDITTLYTNAASQATSINTINANIGAYHIWANANTAGLYNSVTAANTNISATQANIGSFYTYANLNYGTSSYANANVAAYLVANPPAGTYSNTNAAAYLAGNITTGNINVGSIFQLHAADNSLNTTNGSSINVNARLNVNGSAAGYGMVVTNLILANGGLTVSGNSNATSFYGTNYYWANGVSLLSGIGGTYSNSNVASYLPTYSGNVQASSLIVSTSIIATGASPAPVISGFGSISTTGSAVNEGNITASGNLVASRGAFVVGNVTAAQYNFANGVNILSTIAPSSTYSNANIVANLQNYVTSIGTTANITTTANMISPNYLFANGVNILSTITPSSSYSNTNVAAYLPTDSVVTTLQANLGVTQIWANANIASIRANLGATQIWANANIASINANLGGYYTWANANVAGLQSSITSLATNANANTAAYLAAGISTNVTTTGNISAGNVFLNGALTSFGTVNPAYIVVGSVNTVTGVGNGSTVILDTVVGNVNSQTSYNASTGVFTLTAGVTYDMSFTPSFIGFSNTTGGFLCYEWVDATTNTTLDSTGIGMGTVVPTTDTSVQNDNPTARVIYTPSTNQTVKLRVTSGNGTATLRGGIGTQAVVQPLNRPFALQSNITFANVTATNTANVGNLITTSGIYWANGTAWSSTTGTTYSNTNVAAYLTTQTFYSNSNVASYLVANPQGSTYSNANVVANLANYVTNIVSTANITAGNLIGTQYGNTIGTTGTFTGNVSANYFVGNGSALTGLTYNSVGNIYGSSSNVTLQAGSYSWTFDNTGNLVIPTTSNIVYANGTVFTSGTGTSGTNYTNSNVAAMLTANTAVFIGNVGVIGNVATGNIQANATAIFLGGNTVISNYGSPTFGYATHIGNNIYFDANGVQRYRNTQTGAADLIVAPGTLNFYATSGAVTANTATGYTGSTSLYMALSTSGMSLYNSAGLVSSGPVTIQSATGLVTNQATIAVFNGVGSTINMGGVATTITLGQSTPGTSSNIFVGNTIGTQTGNLTVRARGQYNYTTQYGVAGGYNSPPYVNQTLTGGSGTGMTATYSSTGGYVGFPITIVNPGTGYKNGDVLTLPGGGGTTAQIWNYNSNYVGQTGQSDLTLTIDGNLILPGGLSLPANSAVTGDFSNSTFNYRTVFRTTTANATTGIYAVPSGTGTGAAWQAANSSNIANTSKIMITTNGSTDVQLVSGINGTGTYLPLSFLTNGSTQMQLGTAGNLLMVTGGNISTTGNVIAGNIVANQYGNSVGTTATYTGNVTAAYFVGNVVSSGGTTNLVGNVSTGNLTVSGNLISTGYGFFPGAFDENSTSSGVFLGNTNTTPRIGFYNGNTSQNWQIDNSGGQFRWYTPGVTRMYLDANGNLTVTGNLTISGTLNTSISSNVVISGNAGVISPNLTAFRVIGQGGSIGLNANLVASNWTVDYTQGFASTSLNGTTGIFTAPMAGLYSSTLTARTTSNSYASIVQACIMQRKAGIATVAMMIEWGANTTMNHASGGTTVKLAQGDQLWVQCLANGGGTGFSFDGNDHWDVTYLG